MLEQSWAQIVSLDKLDIKSQSLHFPEQYCKARYHEAEVATLECVEEQDLLKVRFKIGEPHVAYALPSMSRMAGPC